MVWNCALDAAENESVGQWGRDRITSPPRVTLFAERCESRTFGAQMQLPSQIADRQGYGNRLVTLASHERKPYTPPIWSIAALGTTAGRHCGGIREV